MSERTDLAGRVQALLYEGPPTFERAGAALNLVEQLFADRGGVTGARLVMDGQLKRFKRSACWQPGSDGRRMTVAEAYAFVNRLTLAAETAIAREQAA